MSFTFDIDYNDKSSDARAGRLHTPRGVIHTPIFMPVGTVATVKGIHMSELEEVIHAEIILANTYHLYLRPGLEVIDKAGGIHSFNSWKKPVLTDSGGFQVYSLGKNRKITEKGVEFRSHIDGSKHLFTPESVVDIQRTIGADIIMAFDECTPYPCPKDYARDSMHMTHRWLDRCFDQFSKTDTDSAVQQCLAPIVQGSVYADLRAQSAAYIASKEAPINAIGGLSVGEPDEDMYAMVELINGILPASKPRYLMGVGTPANLLENIALGIDMFDCVLPSRNARHGMLYTHEGIINIKNEKWKKDFSPIDARSNADTSRRHSKAYLRHLFLSKELLGAQIATLQNLTFYLQLVRAAREKIKQGVFDTWKEKAITQYSQRL
ncbi:tRNA guanosine(34) transglycosylase Tgt [Membranicola marinus]|uniref:Queuine tRNA-ribosyltransferase n=1 Tax=Membranihabitans marinus TaxID=1227546 RepID=A0A953LCT4_9BACT|nr:tRNA guanosine(34) transglycosylase Tgt [Membranihabitans marinus]MBY5958124.1 tRNA guanosine(34) transglycosylase Tgt [Membranihabitans marinus]